MPHMGEHYCYLSAVFTRLCCASVSRHGGAAHEHAGATGAAAKRALCTASSVCSPLAPPLQHWSVLPWNRSTEPPSQPAMVFSSNRGQANKVQKHRKTPPEGPCGSNCLGFDVRAPPGMPKGHLETRVWAAGSTWGSVMWFQLK